MDADAEGEAEGLGLRGEDWRRDGSSELRSGGRMEAVVPAEVLLGRLGWH